MTEIIALGLVKNEIDIVPHVINHMLDEGIEKFIIADNMSTDGTWEYLQSLDKKMFSIIKNEDQAFYHGVKINALMRKAVEMFGSDLVIFPFDADECFYSLDPNLDLSEALLNMNYEVAIATVYDHVPSKFDETTGNPLNDMCLREPDVKALPSVAFRYHPDCVIRDGNHHVAHPGSSSREIIGVRHFQYRSYEHYSNKLHNGKVAVEATTFDDGYCAHWRIGGAKTDEQLRNDWEIYTNNPDLVYDPAPIKSRKK